MTDIGRQLLTFHIAGEAYALPVTNVQRVEARQELTPVPGAPAELPGIFVSQGRIIAALDPRTVLSLPSATERDRQFVVIAREGDLAAGLLVDWVDQVIPINPADLQPAAGRGSDYTFGQVSFAGKTVSVLSLAALLRVVTGE